MKWIKRVDLVAVIYFHQILATPIDGLTTGALDPLHLQLLQLGSRRSGM